VDFFQLLDGQAQFLELDSPLSRFEIGRDALDEARLGCFR